ncbi:MAG: hypothetical protein IPK46_20935 [Saprospiraceae bacterium]|nr:hypothetical protein [Saprospiraceae bacterium]
MDYPNELQKVIDRKGIELIPPHRTLTIGVFVFLGLTLIPVLFVLFSDWVPWVKGVVSFGIAIIFSSVFTGTTLSIWKMFILEFQKCLESDIVNGY